MINLLYFITYLLLYTFTVSASYEMSDSMYSQLRMRSAPGAFTINGTMYILGGYSPGLRDERPTLKQFTAISFNDADGSIQYTDLTKQDTPIVSESYPVILDNNRVLMLGGFCEMEQGTACDNRTLFMAEYRFDSQTWIAPRVPNMNVTMALPPQTVSASLADDGLVYIRYNLAVGESFLPELWSYNPDTYEMVDLTRTVPDMSSFDNAARLSLRMPNGEIAFIAEDMQANYSMSILLLYNPTSQLWRVHDLQGEAAPYGRQYYQMTADPKGARIYFFGGRARDLPNGSFNDLKVLDTTTWTWEDIVAVGTPPGGRFNLAMSFISDDLLVITCGTGDYFWYNDINAIRLADGIIPQWITNIMEPIYIPPDPNQHSINIASIIGGVVGGVVGLTILVLALVFRRRVMRMVGIAYRFWLWSPRMGEPLWTETWRLVIKIILTTITILIVAVNITNILNSPLVTISYIEEAPQVPVPDVRVCLDGVAAGFVGCLTDTISPQKCNDLGLVRTLNMSIHTPFLTQGTGDVSCYLFSTSEPFYLSSPESGQLVDNNGTRVTLRIGYMTSGSAIPYVYITLYPRGRDPNLVKYFQETQDLTDDQMALWLNQERSDTHPNNHYSIGIDTFSTISYQHETRQTLTGADWNKVGFFSEYNNSLELNTDFITTPIDPTIAVVNGNPIMQMVTLTPKDFINVRTRQQKLYTVVSVLGPVGGALALFGAFLVLLFGTRPNSPWGFVQQLSFGGAKRSLMYNLQDSFHPWVSRSVPFVDFTAPLQRDSATGTQKDDHAIDIPSSANPFHDRLNQDIKQHLLDHMDKMEDINRRLQLMEVVFKYYYIDPEVFNRIARAMEKDLKREQSTITEDEHSSLKSSSSHNEEDLPPERSRFGGLLSKFGIARHNRTGHEEVYDDCESTHKRSPSRYSRLAPIRGDHESMIIDSHATLLP